MATTRQASRAVWELAAHRYACGGGRRGVHQRHGGGCGRDDRGRAVSPRTNTKAYQAAQKALKESEELFFSDEELNKMLPKQLRTPHP